MKHNAVIHLYCPINSIHLYVAVNKEANRVESVWAGLGELMFHCVVLLHLEPIVSAEWWIGGWLAEQMDGLVMERQKDGW